MTSSGNIFRNKRLWSLLSYSPKSLYLSITFNMWTYSILTNTNKRHYFYCDSNTILIFIQSSSQLSLWKWSCLPSPHDTGWANLVHRTSNHQEKSLSVCGLTCITKLRTRDLSVQCIFWLVQISLWTGLDYTSTLPSLRDQSKVSSLNYRGILGFLVWLWLTVKVLFKV